NVRRPPPDTFSPSMIMWSAGYSAKKASCHAGETFGCTDDGGAHDSPVRMYCLRLRRRPRRVNGHATASAAERLQALDFFAIWLDAAPHEESRGGEENDGGDEDRLPDFI